MKIRLIKLPAAPLVDGFNLQQYQAGLVGAIHDVDPPLARYLIAAAYAEALTLAIDQAPDSAIRKRRRMPPSS
jgi:hypothetical protein